MVLRVAMCEAADTLAVMASGRAKRVLLYRLGSLGDHLVALPCYRLVARVFPDAERRLLTNIPVSSKAAAAEAVLSGSGLVHGFMTYVVGERGPLALLKLWWMILRWRPDVLVYMVGARGLQVARRDEKFFKLCGVRKIVGLPLTEDLQKNRNEGNRMVSGRETPWFEEEGARLARCLEELGDAHIEEQANWAPGLMEEERAEGVQLVESLHGAAYFAFSLGTKAQSNQWGVERWIALLQQIARERAGSGLVVLGANDEHEVSEAVREAWRAVEGAGPALNLCGAAKPRVSAAVMERAVMFFGHDSGPAHMAASVGTPVLGVYSARMMPGEWTPHGSHVRVVMHWVECGGCLLETCIVERKKCIFSIEVDEVLAATREHLQAMEKRAK